MHDVKVRDIVSFAKGKKYMSAYEILLIRDMVVKHCNRGFGSETVDPTQKFT